MSSSTPAGHVAPAPHTQNPIDSWVFDLDNTLYPFDPDMSLQINALMRSFISRLLGVTDEQAHDIQKDYFRRYGLTIRGLMIHHGVDPRDYIDHMAQLDLSCIKPDPALAEVIGRLNGRKIIYSNAFGRHVADVLERLGMDAHFDEIHHIETADFLPKPDIGAYREFCRRYDVDPTRAAMFEDTPHNLVPAREIGMTTVWVRTGVDWARGAEGADYIDYIVDDLRAWLEQRTGPQPL